MKHKWEIRTDSFEPEWDEEQMKEVTPSKEYVVVKKNTWAAKNAMFIVAEIIVTFGCAMAWQSGALVDSDLPSSSPIILLIAGWITMSIFAFMISLGSREEYIEDGCYSSMKKAIIKRDYLNSKEEKQ